MDYYKEGRKVYLGIENIHVMRDSLKTVADALRDADSVVPSSSETTTGLLDRQALRRSGWLKHLSGLLDGALIIVKNVHVNSSHVLIHCSDGWDRTAQLSTLAQLCLDPYYRTYRGFQVLVEKDWVSFGHRFLDRCGHLSSEKFFLTPSTDGSADGGPQAFFASVQNKFTSPSHLKETSPVFHQFLECVRQIQRQYPTRFEFNERFLERLHYHLYSCQFGTFLFNNERDRRVAPDATSQATFQRTQSVWDDLNSEPERSRLLNPDYNPSLDARDGASRTGDLGVLFPDPRDVKFWHELYGRTDDEMNGRVITQTSGGVTGADVVGPVEGAADDPAQPSTPSRIVLSLTDDIDATAAQIVPLHPAGPRLASSSVNGETASSAFPVPGTPSSPNLSAAIARSPSPSVPSVLSFAASPPREADTSAWGSLSPLPSSSPRPSSPARRGTSNNAGGIAPGAFAASAAGGMKSLWGSISSNASAAFSVVQEAYDKNAKELLVGGGTRPAASSSPSPRERELADAGSARSHSPWASSSTPGLDNWSSSAQSQRAPERSWSTGAGRSVTASGSGASGYALPAELDDPWSSHNQPLQNSKDSERELTASVTSTQQQSAPFSRFASSAERASPSHSSPLPPALPTSPTTLGRAVPTSTIVVPARQLSDLTLKDSPWSSKRESPLQTDSRSEQQPNPPVSPTVPLPSQNPYLGVRAPSPSALPSASSSSTELTLDERDPAVSPSRSRSRSPALPPQQPVQGGRTPTRQASSSSLAAQSKAAEPAPASDGRELDPLGVGFLG